MKNFTDQVAIVTGATRGIGRAITLAFLEQGATVLGLYGGNSEVADVFQKECSEYGERLQLHKCNVADAQSVKDFFTQVENKYSSIDILVNNAGIRRDAITALMEIENWQAVIDVNLTGNFLMAKEAVLLMMKKKYGRIINITSAAAYLGFPGQSNYSASKAGQIGLTRSLAKETAKKKITVNCVSPGFIATDFINDLNPAQLQEYKKVVPMRRFGTPEEVAHSVLFLASKEASYITGAVLEINGGL